MGHARSYITFDILRRVLSDYFDYDVLYCMNITDIDDKIINRARHTHLVQVYMEENHPEMKILQDLDESLSLYADKLEKTTDEDKRAMMTKIITAAREQKEIFEKEMTALSGDDLKKARGN